MQKKIIFFLPNFSQGGAAQSIVKILIYLSNKKNKCELICLKKCFYKKTLLENGIKVLEIKSSRALYSMYRIRNYLLETSNHYKIYFVSNINYANILSLIFLKKIPKIKIITVERTPLQELNYNYGSMILFFKNFLLKSLIKLLYFKSDLRIGNSIRVSKDFALFSKTKFITIYPQSIKMISKKNISYIEKDLIRIIWVGRLDKEKSFKTLVDALNFNFNKKIEVSVLGPGNKHLHIKRNYVNKNVIFKFYGYQKNLEKYFLKSDIYIHTALYEGFPNSVIQAMNYGIPVISSNSEGGIKEITNKGKYATLFKTENHNELRKILTNYLYSNKTFIKKALLAKKNLQTFNFKSVLDQYRKKLQSL